jgi:hypothetical protein
MIDNPWKQSALSEPYVLDIDKPQIDSYNVNKFDDPGYMHIELLPEPFYGNPQAPVMLLSLNPGYAKNADADFYNLNEAACRLNLEHATQEYPFYLLNPAYREYTGHQWWYKHLSALIKDTTLQRVATNVCCVEFFPYHSRSFKASRLKLKSAYYRHELVVQAKNDGHLIIMRAARHWYGAIPELKTYTNVCTLNSPQNPTISPNNMPPEWYDRLKNAI